MQIFLSTSPARGTTKIFACPLWSVWISIHVPREGDDRPPNSKPRSGTISIHVPREGDDRPPNSKPRSGTISIHVPREGDDIRTFFQIVNRFFISIHVPREGDD